MSGSVYGKPTREDNESRLALRMVFVYKSKLSQNVTNYGEMLTYRKELTADLCHCYPFHERGPVEVLRIAENAQLPDPNRLCY